MAGPLIRSCKAKEWRQCIDGGGVEVTPLSDRPTQRRTPEEMQHPRPPLCSACSQYRMSMLSSLTLHTYSCPRALRTLCSVSALLFPTDRHSWPLSTSCCRSVYCGLDRIHTRIPETMNYSLSDRAPKLFSILKLHLCLDFQHCCELHNKTMPTDSKSQTSGDNWICCLT